VTFAFRGPKSFLPNEGCFEAQALVPRVQMPLQKSARVLKAEDLLGFVQN
jgi:hypothetical protein